MSCSELKRMIGYQGGSVCNGHQSDQSIKKFISASLLFNKFMKDVRINLLQVNMIYEGQ